MHESNATSQAAIKQCAQPGHSISTTSTIMCQFLCADAVHPGLPSVETVTNSAEWAVSPRRTLSARSLLLPASDGAIDVAADSSIGAEATAFGGAVEHLQIGLPSPYATPMSSPRREVRA